MLSLQFISEVIYKHCLPGKVTYVLPLSQLRHPNRDEWARDQDPTHVAQILGDLIASPDTVLPLLHVMVVADAAIKGTDTVEGFLRNQTDILANEDVKYVILGGNHLVAAVTSVSGVP